MPQPDLLRHFTIQILNLSAPYPLIQLAFFAPGNELDEGGDKYYVLTSLVVDVVNAVSTVMYKNGEASTGRGGLLMTGNNVDFLQEE